MIVFNSAHKSIESSFQRPLELSLTHHSINSDWRTEVQASFNVTKYKKAPKNLYDMSAISSNISLLKSDYSSKEKRFLCFDDVQQNLDELLKPSKLFTFPASVNKRLQTDNFTSFPKKRSFEALNENKKAEEDDNFLQLRYKRKLLEIAQEKQRAQFEANLKREEQRVPYFSKVSELIKREDTGSALKYYKSLLATTARTQQIFEDVLNQKIARLDRKFIPEKLNLKPDLTFEEVEQYKEATSMRLDENDVVSTVENSPIKRKDTITLSPGNWLNDEVINTFMVLLRRYTIKHLPKEKQCYFHSTFFFNKLSENNSYNYSNVKKWTKRGRRKCNIFSQRLVFIPVNVHNTHWTLVVVDIENKNISYYDSMGSQGEFAVDLIARYLQDESMDKLNKQLELSSWTLGAKGKSIPQQRNGFDCGVFVCIFSYYLVFEQELDFDQADMSYFRKRICLDILHDKLALED
eukprot:augustus_masked-scaffold_15-processed-gene-6.49-mRNA-1 protein AED:0.24 eAED:0.25 QI:0/-1/0/1/-1/1/1/0/463